MPTVVVNTQSNVVQQEMGREEGSSSSSSAVTLACSQPDKMHVYACIPGPVRKPCHVS